MKDRNTKSLTNQWTRIGKDMAALEDLEDGAAAATPTPKKGTATKRKSAVKQEDENGTSVKKRGRNATVKTEPDLPAVKKEDEADSNDEF
ncbi:hypothetical protein ISF_05564 [Cordyceps fumosorosea ARSEF 2679]|uniref:Uncharacterized protein n=1 Tax=Cordyceps fumosorosea (strain ARSEF 2679) TaxID=1081104 RepID=A0A167UDR1_CORFA|nr:hypothetical protein ISF_05564 [Cordyceps fumosorosea ARSEF 2679]OAA61485.1 hypothetical protein ISF_05564 [Cordyceps fumosorosea ARSEF 2679]